MNNISNNFLLAGDKFIPEMHFKHTYSACSACSTCRPFTKIKKRIEKFKEKGNSRYIYKNELDKAWFQHSYTDILKINHEKWHLTKNYYHYF